ncbi:MAG: hypothetical protein FWF59_12085 [Turicibacter sp.]|nr:hypothetical protein [Turicibacter sp.]
MENEWIDLINHVWVQIDYHQRFPIIRIYDEIQDKQLNLSVPEFNAIKRFIEGELK